MKKIVFVLVVFLQTSTFAYIKSSLTEVSIENQIDKKYVDAENIDKLLDRFRLKVNELVGAILTMNFKEIKLYKSELESIRATIQKQESSLSSEDYEKIKRVFNESKELISQVEESAFNANPENLPHFQSAEVNTYVESYENYILTLAKAFYTGDNELIKETYQKSDQFITGLKIISNKLAPEEFNKMATYINEKNAQVLEIEKL